MNAPRYIDSVHLMRGVAAMMVVLEHVIGRTPYPVFNSWFAFADGLGQMGVSAFFVISGLVLPLSLGAAYRWAKLPNFLLRRIVRIEPTFLCSALAASALVFLMTALAPEGKLWWPSLTQLALHAFYLIPFSQEEWILPVYWTLAVEFQFYIAIGLLFPLVTMLARRSSDLAVLLCASFSLTSYVATLVPELQLLKYAPCFALGMVVAGRAMFVVRPATVLLAVALVVVVAWDTALALDTMVGSGAAAIIASCWSQPIDRKSRWVRPWWWMGTISYSLYVTHQALASAGENVARFALRLNDGWVGQVVANLVPFGTMAVCFVVAWALYHWVERPTFEFSKRLRK